MKKVASIFILMFLCMQAFPSEGHLSWNVVSNINDFVQIGKNVERENTKNKSTSLSIKRQNYGVKADTELYITFDQSIQEDQTGNYVVTYGDYLISENVSTNNKAGYFIYDENKVELKGNNKSFFQPGINLSSFTFNYWIYPMTTTFDEEVVRIGRQYFNREKNEIRDQSIINRLEDGRLVCDFNYVFVDKKDYVPNVSVKSYGIVKPNQWNNIIMTFDSFSGIIRLYINGVEEGIGIANASTRIDADVYDLRFAPTNKCLIKLCDSFTGMMDEFYIFTGVKSEYFDKYDKNGGEVLSKVINLDQFGGFIEKISTIDVTPNMSEIRYYYRTSDRPFSYNSTEDELPWIYLHSEEFEHKLVKYIQFKLILLPGIDNDVSPLFKQLSVDYKRNIPPSQPVGLKVMPQDNGVKLKWVRNSELDVKGYKIYFGTHSNTYYADNNGISNSPMIIDANADFDHSGILISGLDNNTIYYFSVTAFDDVDGDNESDFAKEVYCRPGVLDIVAEN